VSFFTGHESMVKREPVKPYTFPGFKAKKGQPEKKRGDVESGLDKKSQVIQTALESKGGAFCRLDCRRRDREPKKEGERGKGDAERRGGGRGGIHPGGIAAVT